MHELVRNGRLTARARALLYLPQCVSYEGANSHTPVSLISTTQPLVSFSMRRRKEASKSRKPGLASLVLISSIRIDFPLRVDSSRRNLKLFEPLYLSTIVVLKLVFKNGGSLDDRGFRPYSKHINLLQLVYSARPPAKSRLIFLLQVE